MKNLEDQGHGPAAAGRFPECPGFDSTFVGTVFAAVIDSILLTDERGVIWAANRAALQSFRYTEHELLGQNIAILIPEFQAGDQNTFHPCAEVSTVGVGRERTGRRKHGECFALHLSLSEFVWQGRKMLIGICHDITERRKHTERIAFLAAHDGLTGCLNRGQFLQTLAWFMREGQDSGQSLAVLFIDLDGFKAINDNHGHRVGDRLLKQVAERLRGKLREGDLLGRVGGDEFVALVLLEDEPDLAREVAARLVASLQRPFVVDGIPLAVNVSIGISVFATPGQTADELMNEADVAMYQAKLDGGSCVRIFSQALRERTELTYRLLNDLRRAIAQQQFELHYQLQFDMHTLRPSGMEALLRWRDGERGLLLPDQFMPIALEYGLTADIERWALHQACRDNAELFASELLDVSVAVNISRPLFSKPGFAPLVCQALRNTGLEPKHLELEISEGIAMDPDAQIQQNMQELVEAGVHLILDEFGAGSSSLARLKSLTFNKVKLDRRFVAGLPDNARDRSIIRAVVGMADGLGLRMAAEGIETAEQMAWLQAAGCAQGQGSWYARPMPLEDLRVWLGNIT